MSDLNSVPIPVIELFPELNDRLLRLLRSLTAEEWRRPTVCSEWCVKDVAAHLLDSCLRRLSLQRDGYVSPQAAPAIESNADLVKYLHQLNRDWTRATARLSPRILIEWLEQAGDQLPALFESWDPYGPALFPVGWAGEATSQHWFDVAREYTERWHHHRQIIDAINRPSNIDTRRLYHPVLDAFLQALPFTFRQMPAEPGTWILVRIVGEAGGDWSLQRSEAHWQLGAEPDNRPAATVTLSQEIAWRLFTKRTDRATARVRFPEIRIEGDEELGGLVLEMVSIMA